MRFRFARLKLLFTRIAYLEFAGRWFGKVSYDLATSGLRPISAAAIKRTASTRATPIGTRPEGIGRKRFTGCWRSASMSAMSLTV